MLLLATGLLGAGGVAWHLYLHYSDPDTVRRLALDWAEQVFPSIRVHLGSADASLWDGVRLRQVRVELADKQSGTEILRLEHVSILPNRNGLLKGMLLPDRVRLHRPVIHLHQRADGTWNVAHLLTGRLIRFPCVTEILIEDAAVEVTFEDPAKDAIHVDHASGKAKLAPPGEMTWELRGQNSLAKEFVVVGRADFVANRIDIEAKTQKSLDLAELCRQLPASAQESMRDCKDISGAVDLEAVATLRKPKEAWEWEGSILGRVSQASLSHDRLPHPIREAQGTFVATQDCLTVPELHLMIGASTASFSARVPSWDLRRAEAEGNIQDVELTPALRRSLDEPLRKLWDRFHPSGFADVHGRVVRLGDEVSLVGHADFHDVAFRYESFPYPVDDVSGRANLTEEGAVALTLVGRARGAEVEITGNVEQSPAPTEFLIRAFGVPLDEELLRSLPGATAQFVRDMRPGATVGDVTCKVSRARGNERFTYEADVDVRASEATYAGFPYRLEKVHGHLKILPKHVVFRDFVGSCGSTQVKVEGQAITHTEGTHVEVGIVAERVLLDDRLARSLPQHCQDAFAKLHAEGRINLAANVVKSPGSELFLEIEVDPAEASLEPEQFPYRLDSFQGRVLYRDKQIQWKPMAFRHGSVVLQCSGSVTTDADGGSLELRELVSNNLVYDESLRRAAPASLRKTLDALQPTKPVGIRFPRIRLDWDVRPRPSWEMALEGGIALEGADLMGGTLQDVTGVVWYRGQCKDDEPKFQGNIELAKVDVCSFHATNVRSSFQVDGGRLDMPNVRGDMYGGQMHAGIHAVFEPEAVFDCRMNLYGGRLREYMRSHSRRDSNIDGLTYLDLYVQGTGADFQQMTGRGKLDILEADIDRLPLLQDIFRIGNLQPPAGKAFEELTSNFRIEGKRIAIERLELLGPAEIVGPSFNLVNDREGTLDTETREVELMLSARWGRGRFRIPVLTPSFNLANDQVWSFHVRGKIDDPIITPAPLKGFFRILREVSDDDSKGSPATKPR